METITTRALLLRQVDTGESDRVVTLLTEERGKVSAMARGARRSRKRFGAALQPFVLAEAALERRRSGSLLELRSYHALDAHEAIGRDLGAIAHASYATELTASLCPEDHPEPLLFQALLGLFRLLGRLPPDARRLRIFELTVLTGAGLAPQLEACVRCGSASLEGEGEACFDVVMGGVLCARCGAAGRPVRRETLQGMRMAQKLSLEEASALILSPEVQTELRDLMIDYVQHAVGRPLKTVQFIEKLR